MQRLRSTWMALMGGILLITLSISAAFGAPPPATEDGPRGLSVAAFVHELVFGEQAPDVDPEENEEEEEELEEEDVDEQEVEEQLEGEESDTHGACVSEVAQDKEGANDPEDAEYANHGERVSDAARFLCREEAEDEEDLDEEVVEEEEPEEESEESDAHGACVSEVAQDKEGANDPEDAEYRNHGERVSDAARFLCPQTDEDEEPTELEEQDEESDAGSSTAGPGNSGQAGAHGKANAPGQQRVQAGGSRGGPPSWAGQGGPGGGNGRGGR